MADGRGEPADRRERRTGDEPAEQRSEGGAADGDDEQDQAQLVERRVGLGQGVGDDDRVARTDPGRDDPQRDSVRGGIEGSRAGAAARERGDPRDRVLAQHQQLTVEGRVGRAVGGDELDDVGDVPGAVGEATQQNRIGVGQRRRRVAAGRGGSMAMTGRWLGKAVLGLHERARQRLERAVDVAVEVVSNQHVGRQ